MTSDADGPRLRISEVFGPTIQGEGALTGRPTVFVRTGGCSYRCLWCDTLFAVLPEYRGEWQDRTTADVLAEVDRRAGGPILVTLSGGDPALQDLGPLIRAGHDKGHTFALESQGALAPAWLAELDQLTLSPKGPSSGQTTSMAEVAAALTAAGSDPAVTLKCVVLDEADFRYARQLADHFPAVPFYLQVGNPHPEAEPDRDALLARYRWLVERTLAERWYSATVLPQLHVLVWGGSRGV